jgi:hypothetical protein
LPNEPGLASDSAARNSQRAVFLSYASEDADAAQRICAALRAAGIEVCSCRSSFGAIAAGGATGNGYRRAKLHRGAAICGHEREEGPGLFL